MRKKQNDYNSLQPKINQPHPFYPNLWSFLLEYPSSINPLPFIKLAPPLPPNSFLQEGNKAVSISCSLPNYNSVAPQPFSRLLFLVSTSPTVLRHTTDNKLPPCICLHHLPKCISSWEKWIMINGPLPITVSTDMIRRPTGQWMGY